jgi:hypothetical protein
VAEEIFHIVAKNPKKKHVPGNVGDTGVQKHAGYQREKRTDEIDISCKKSGKARGNGGIGHQESLG